MMTAHAIYKQKGDQIHSVSSLEFLPFHYGIITVENISTQGTRLMMLKFARFPLSVIRKIRIIRYWYTINRNPSSLMHKGMYLKENNVTFINTWSKNVINLLSSLGYAYI